MLASPKIERYEVVTAQAPEQNQYGDLIFSDTEGKSHKIGSKRLRLFDQIIDGRAVKLGYAVYMEKEYIASAVLYDGVAAGPTIKAESGGVKAETVHKLPTSSPEVGMCWNNVGNRIGDGSIERDYPKSAVKIKSQYYKYIFGVTGIQLE